MPLRSRRFSVLISTTDRCWPRPGRPRAGPRAFEPLDAEAAAAPDERGGTAEWTPLSPADALDTSVVDQSPRGRERARLRARRRAARAKDIAALGNNVRAALIWTKAAKPHGSSGGDAERAAARAELKHLADRLQKALFIRKGEAEIWADALAPLLHHAAVGFGAPEAAPAVRPPKGLPRPRTRGLPSGTAALVVLRWPRALEATVAASPRSDDVESSACRRAPALASTVGPGRPPTVGSPFAIGRASCHRRPA